MARYKGHNGDVSVGGDSVGERISFDIELTSNTADASTMGTGWTDTDGLQNSATGTLEVFYDPSDTAQAAMTVGATVACIFYPAGNTTGLQTLTGNFLIERVGHAVSVGDLVKTSYSLRNKGAITLGTVA